MKIESIATRPDRAGRYLVKFSDEHSMRLYSQTIGQYGLYSGMELTEEEYSQLREAAGEMSAKMRSVRIVAASNVSKKELQERLIRKGERLDQAIKAVEWMSELELVDDAKTASLIVSQCARKGYGIVRAKQALYEKRIPKEFWEDALSDYPDQSQYIIDYLQSRLAEGRNEKELKRAVDALLRRGHYYSDIRRCLTALDAEELLEDSQWH